MILWIISTHGLIAHFYFLLYWSKSWLPFLFFHIISTGRLLDHHAFPWLFLVINFLGTMKLMVQIISTSGLRSYKLLNLHCTQGQDSFIFFLFFFLKKCNLILVLIVYVMHNFKCKHQASLQTYSCTNIPCKRLAVQ